MMSLTLFWLCRVCAVTAVNAPYNGPGGVGMHDPYASAAYGAPGMGMNPGMGMHPSMGMHGMGHY